MFKTVVLCLALLFSGSAMADAANPEQALTAALEPLHGLRGRFQQTLSDANGDILQQVEGNFTVVRPALLLWRTEPPYEQLIVADGERLWLYDPDLQQVISQSYRENLARTPALLLVGQTQGLNEHYRVSLSLSDAERVFSLQPLDADSLYSKIVLRFREQTPSAMILWDSLGQQTQIIFQDLERNPQIDPADFTFVAPAGADIIHND